MINDPNSAIASQLAITIDGQKTTFTEGETIYQVATRLKKDIPTLCYDDRLDAFGGCRLCVVEVEGIRNPVASCTTKANDGMVVKTAPPRPKSGAGFLVGKFTMATIGYHQEVYIIL